MTLNHSISKRGATLALLTAALLAGCSSVPLDTGVPVETRTAGTAGGAGATTGGAGTSKVEPVDLTKGAGNMANLGKVIYFDFDSYVVKDEYRGTIDSYAKALAVDRKKRISAEGHTDERGGREYNLALGQKRAEAVAKSLALLGAGDSQVEAVSFGKERPAVQGSDEAAWAKNRRVELNSK